MLALEDIVQRGGVELDGPGEYEDPVPKPSAPTGGDEAKQKQQSKSRRICCQMLSLDGRGPMAEVIVLSNVIEPQRRFMADLL
eukprot:6481171-Pyramimonas_sp.AAC.1